GLKLLVDPQRLARGRVRKRIAYGLRTCRVFAKIAALVVGEPRRPVDSSALGWRGVVRQLFGKDELPVHMGRDQTLRPLMRQRVPVRGADVDEVNAEPVDLGAVLWEGV